jgi:hypothetical protein
LRAPCVGVFFAGVREVAESPRHGLVSSGTELFEISAGRHTPDSPLPPCLSVPPSSGTSWTGALLRPRSPASKGAGLCLFARLMRPLLMVNLSLSVFCTTSSADFEARIVAPKHRPSTSSHRLNPVSSFPRVVLRMILLE